MSSKTTNKFSVEVRTRAVRMVQEHGGEYPSRWAAVVSVAGKIGCSAHTLNEWLKKAERGGSVCLNSLRGFGKWILALVMPLPGLASAH